MKILFILFTVIVGGVILIGCWRQLIWAFYQLSDLRQAQKHPEEFPHTDNIVFNRKTNKLEESQRPILPSE